MSRHDLYQSKAQAMRPHGPVWAGVVLQGPVPGMLTFVQGCSMTSAIPTSGDRMSSLR